MYQKCRLPAITVQISADLHLSSVDDAIAATREPLCDEQPDPPPSGVILVFLLDASDNEGQWEFGSMLADFSAGRE